MNKFIVIIFLVFSQASFANEVSVGRYTIAETQASNAQRFPLVEVRTETIPPQLRSITEAIDYLLIRTGYSQASLSVRSLQDQALMQKPVALSNRKLVNLTVLEMLSIIAGLGYVPVVDPINRLVAFEAVYEFK